MVNLRGSWIPGNRLPTRIGKVRSVRRCERPQDLTQRTRWKWLVRRGASLGPLLQSIQEVFYFYPSRAYLRRQGRDGKQAPPEFRTPIIGNNIVRVIEAMELRTRT